MAPADGVGAAVAVAPAAPSDEVKPYRIHVSSKYLDLTKEKLRLTRLPHEGSETKSRDWWEPKSRVEPLIDFWLERYSWRDQESALNTTIPQFRTTILVPTSPSSSAAVTPGLAPVRIHLIHARSPHSGAVPLLLIPPFPFTNLSLGHLIGPLTSPADPARDQPFHLVVPSLPGIGFSDTLPSSGSMIGATARLFDAVMRRLGYDHYLATNAGSGGSSPAQIDWRLASRLATAHRHSCLGVHLIAPPMAPPALRRAPAEWARWSLARLFRAPVLGYSRDDFESLRRARRSPAPALPSRQSRRLSRAGRPNQATSPPPPPPPPPPRSKSRKGGGAHIRLREPNTLAYALCDSPTGLLVTVLKLLRVLGPAHPFSAGEIVTLTELAWLPGPEGAMRFWAHCANENEHEAGVWAGDDSDEDGADSDEEAKKARTRDKTKARVAITVFTGERVAMATATAATTDGAEGESGEDGADDLLLPRPAGTPYACPRWGNAWFDVVHSNREPGTAGLLAWERPEVIAAGARALAGRVLAADERLRPSAAPAPPPPAGPVAVPEAAETAEADGGGGGATGGTADENTSNTTTDPTADTAAGPRAEEVSSQPQQQQQQQQQQQAPYQSGPARPPPGRPAKLESVPEQEQEQHQQPTRPEGGQDDEEEDSGDGKTPDTVIAAGPAGI